MGRGRQKAKQQKIARKLKYLTTDTDYDELAKELSEQEPGMALLTRSPTSMTSMRTRMWIPLLMTTLPVPPRQLPLRRRMTSTSTPSGCRSRRKGDQRRVPGLRACRTEAGPAQADSDAHAFRAQAQEELNAGLLVIIPLCLVEHKGFVVMADGAAAGGLLTLRASQRQQVAQVVALADRADVAGVLFLCPCGDAAGSRSQTSGSSSMTSGGVRLCGSDSGPSKILTAPHGATRTSTPGPGARRSSRNSE